MTHSISDPIAANGHTYIVPLRTSGAGTPLFCFASIDRFQELTAVLPEGQPVYAIELGWLTSAQEEFTVEKLVLFYLDIIRKIQRTGPYYFCGYSFGGLMAYEMARRLIEKGDCAALVALLDAPNPALTSNLKGSDAVQFHKTYLVDRLKKYGRMLRQFDIKKMTSSGLTFAVSRLGSYILPTIRMVFQKLNRPLPSMFRVSDISTILVKAWRSYVPQPYATSLVLFRVQDRGPEYDLDPSMGWEACVAGGVQVQIVPGTHAEMMDMPYVQVIAEKLASYLDNGSNHSRSVPTPGAPDPSHLGTREV
jgi:thioesterase domain-containing protein